MLLQNVIVFNQQDKEKESPETLSKFPRQVDPQHIVNLKSRRKPMS
jgi:hypothetical protein